MERHPDRAVPSSARRRASAPAEPPADPLTTVANEVAHDLGNLLAVMVGQLSLLEPIARSTPEARESLDEMRKAIGESVTRLRDLVAAIRRAHHQTR